MIIQKLFRGLSDLTARALSLAAKLCAAVFSAFLYAFISATPDEDVVEEDFYLPENNHSSRATDITNEHMNY